VTEEEWQEWLRRWGHAEIKPERMPEIAKGVTRIMGGTKEQELRLLQALLTPEPKGLQ
jgi:hypothetical protein